MIDRKTSRSRGFGFVTFETEDSLPAVIRTEHEISGKWVEVKRAEPRESRFAFVKFDVRNITLIFCR